MGVRKEEWPPAPMRPEECFGVQDEMGHTFRTVHDRNRYKNKQDTDARTPAVLLPGLFVLDENGREVSKKEETVKEKVAQ